MQEISETKAEMSKTGRRLDLMKKLIAVDNPDHFVRNDSVKAVKK
jgi:hypothetical protein